MRPLLFVAALGAVSVGATAFAQVRLLVPLYTYPGVEDPGAYGRVAAQSDVAPTTVIVNPCDGPIDPTAPAPCSRTDYEQHLLAIDTLRTGAPTLRLLGYVETNRVTSDGANAQAVRDDVDTYAAHFTGSRAVDGIFFDEVPSGPAGVAIYRELCAYAKAAGFDEVVLNPGTAFDPAYLDGSDCDAAVALEDALGGSEDWPTYSLPSALQGLPPEKLGVLIFEAPGTGTMEEVVDQAVARGFGLVYVTDDPENPNPWNQLATYWEAETARVAAVLTNAEGPPKQGGGPLSVFPNPTTGPASVDVAGPVRLDVLDVLGRAVRTLDVSGGSERVRFNLGDLPAGVYLVAVVDADGRRQSATLTVAR